MDLDVNNEAPGTKNDTGKPRWNLLDFATLHDLAVVLTDGGNMHGDNNWRKLDPERIKAALMRHVSAIMQGEDFAEDTHSSHVAHAMANLMFLDWFRRQREES